MLRSEAKRLLPPKLCLIDLLFGEFVYDQIVVIPSAPFASINPPGMMIDASVVSAVVKVTDNAMPDCASMIGLLRPVTALMTMVTLRCLV